jgi:hypothetical protein
MHNFTNPGTDLDDYGTHNSQNILHNEVPKFYQQGICGPKPDSLHAAIEADINVLGHTHTWGVIVGPANRTIEHFK